MSWKLSTQHPDSREGYKVSREFQGFGLTPRLESMAACVGIGTRVVDVGCDHGLLPIALVGSGRSHGAIAADLRPQPLELAAQNIARFTVGHLVEARLGDGLSVLEPFEVDTVTIAGMGGERIGRILTARSLRDLGIRRVIVQPNSDHTVLRQGMAGIDWEITYERLVVSDHRLFVVMVFEEAEENVVLSGDDAFLGPYLRQSPDDPLYQIWLHIQSGHLEAKLAGLASASDSIGELKQAQAQASWLRALIEGS